MLRPKKPHGSKNKNRFSRSCVWRRCRPRDANLALHRHARSGIMCCRETEDCMPQVTPMSTGEVSVRCCIAGGGPAGMMLGFLLARAGVDVLVLEKHADFLRDFRGDTIHPSTLQVMHELGILDELLKLPHQEARQLAGYVADQEVIIADFSHLP